MIKCFAGIERCQITHTHTQRKFVYWKRLDQVALLDEKCFHFLILSSIFIFRPTDWHLFKFMLETNQVNLYFFIESE